MKRVVSIILLSLFVCGAVFAADEDLTTFTLTDAQHEDFTVWNESDEGGDITIDSATKVSWTALGTRNDTGYVYKDFGADFFDGDFTHQFEIEWSSLANVSITTPWGVHNAVGDVNDWVGAGDDGALIYLWDNVEEIRFAVMENGGLPYDSWAGGGPQANTLYFITVDRNDDGGANNTGQYLCYIRTGSHAGALQDTMTKDSAAGEQNDLRYATCIATYDDSGGAAASSGYTQNFDLNIALATIDSPAKVSWDDLDSRDRTYHVSRDYGAGYWAEDEDFNIKFEIQFSDPSGFDCDVYHYALTSTAGDFYDVDAASEDGVGIYSTWNDGTPDFWTINLAVLEAGAIIEDPWGTDGGGDNPAASTTYFVELDRTGDVYTAYIRTGSHSGALKDTLTKTASNADIFRYGHAMSTYDSALGTGVTVDGFTQNLNLGEAVGDMTFIIPGYAALIATDEDTAWMFPGGPGVIDGAGTYEAPGGVDMGPIGWWHLYHH